MEPKSVFGKRLVKRGKLEIMVKVKNLCLLLLKNVRVVYVVIIPPDCSATRIRTDVTDEEDWTRLQKY